MPMEQNKMIRAMAMFWKNGKIRGRKMRAQRSRELWQQIGEVWRLSLPAILTQITTIAMQYIDSAMVGALGANASAAIGLVASTTWLFGGITYAISAGFSVQVAHHIPEFFFPAVQRRHGDTKYPECNHVCVGCDFQCTSDTKIWSYGCRDGNGARLCMCQPDYDSAVLYPQ